MLLGNGDGTLQQRRALPQALEHVDIASADFNGDGKIDLAVTNFYANTVTVLLGNGDGTFTAAGKPCHRNLTQAAIAVGDFNGDG